MSRRVVAEYVVPAATIVGVLAVWEVATAVLRIPRFIMPAPSARSTAGTEASGADAR